MVKPTHHVWQCTGKTKHECTATDDGNPKRPEFATMLRDMHFTFSGKPCSVCGTPVIYFTRRQA